MSLFEYYILHKIKHSLALFAHGSAKEVMSCVRLRDILARVAEGENGRCHCRIAMEYIHVCVHYAALCIL